jgi:hypothetical protein
LENLNELRLVRRLQQLEKIRSLHLPGFVSEGAIPGTVDVNQPTLGVGDLDQVVGVVEKIQQARLGLGAFLRLTCHRQVRSTNRIQGRSLGPERHEHTDQ